MSEARAGSMGKIQAVIDGHAFTIDNPSLITDEMELDQAASVQSNQDLLEEQRLVQARLKTEADIQRLEEAKRKATSQTVKDDLAAEVALIKSERLKAEEEEEETTPSDLVKSKLGEAKSTIEDATNRAIGLGKEGWNGLGNVATPGSIFLPVSVLIVFFLLLLPVNGHTRIEWLWLALTGNAQIDQGAGADFNTGSTGGEGSANFGTTSAPVNASRVLFTGPSEVF